MEDQPNENEIETADAISALGSDPTTETNSNGDSKTPTIASHESIPPAHSYQIKPLLPDKFRASPVKEIIKNAMLEMLTGKTYDAENVKKWTADLANDINNKVTELKFKRYKHIVQVTIGENKGAGVRAGMRCLWDAETDGYTSDIFTNVTIFK